MPLPGWMYCHGGMEKLQCMEQFEPPGNYQCGMQAEELAGTAMVWVVVALIPSCCCLSLELALLQVNSAFMKV